MQEIYSLIQLQEATLTRLLGDEPADGLPKHISESIQGLIVAVDAIDSRIGSYVRIDTQASSTSALETRLLAAIQYEEAPLGGMIGAITKRVIKTGWQKAMGWSEMGKKDDGETNGVGTGG